MMTFDGATGHLLMFRLGWLEPNSLWSWEGSHWTLLATNDRITGQNASMAYYPDFRETVIYVPASNETWVWAAGKLIQLHPAHSPQGAPVRLAYNPAAHALDYITWSGEDSEGGNISLGGLWRFNGSDWSGVTDSAQGPFAGGTAAVSFDPVARTWLAFGGFRGSPPTSTFNRTSVWNEAGAWQPLGPSTEPPARLGLGWAFSTYDPDLGLTVMYGGLVGPFWSGSELSDTWGWNGYNWTLLAS